MRLSPKNLAEWKNFFTLNEICFIAHTALIINNNKGAGKYGADFLFQCDNLSGGRQS